MDVGVKELRARLSEYLDQVEQGGEVVITERGRAVARLVPIAGGRALDQAVARGLVSPAKEPSRSTPARRVTSRGSVSALVRQQRR